MRGGGREGGGNGGTCGKEGGEGALEPLGIARLGSESGMCENAAEGWEGGLDACNVGVIKCADGFGDEVWPGGGGDDELGKEAVKVGFDDETGG